MKMKLVLITISAITLMAASGCHAMWRIRHAPVRPTTPAPKLRMPVACQKVAEIKKQYPLPKAKSGSGKIAHMTGPELRTHLRYDELCHKASMSAGQQERAKDHLKVAARKLAAKCLPPAITAALLFNNVDEISTSLFAAACGYSFFSGSEAFRIARQALQDYKESKKKVSTAADELAAMVAEQKFKFKVPYDIQ